MLADEISAKANSLLVGKARIKLLEAGCGSASHFKFQPEVKSVGIDISQEQLDRNRAIQEQILGDLQTYPLPREEFDIVVCWDVIEHLSRPRDALKNMFAATKPEGLLILGFPNLGSFKGIVTKYTPFWFHELFYRFMKYSSRPFKTYLRWAILPRNVRRFAENNGCSVVYCRLVEGGVTRKVRERLWPIHAFLTCGDFVARVLSFGRIPSLTLDGCALILQKESKLFLTVQSPSESHSTTQPGQC
jgi:SAM-dependent methyltransferase